MPSIWNKCWINPQRNQWNKDVKLEPPNSVKSHPGFWQPQISSGHQSYLCCQPWPMILWLCRVTELIESGQKFSVEVSFWSISEDFVCWPHGLDSGFGKSLCDPVPLSDPIESSHTSDWVITGEQERLDSCRWPCGITGNSERFQLPFCSSFWVLMLKAWWLLFRSLCCVSEVFLINPTDDKHPLSSPLLLFSFWKLCACLISSVVWLGSVLETRHGKTLIYNILKSDSSSLEILMFSQLGELLHICFYVFALVLRKFNPAE